MQVGLDTKSINRLKEALNQYTTTKSHKRDIHEVATQISNHLANEIVSRQNFQGKYGGMDIVNNIVVDVNEDTNTIHIQILPVSVEKDKPYYAPTLDKAILFEFGIGIKGQAKLGVEKEANAVKLNWNDSAMGYEGRRPFRDTIIWACEEFGLNATMTVNGGEFHYGGDN